jgi:hypothetical protein
MNQIHRILRVLPLLVAAAGLLVGCEEEDNPATPAPPFLFSNIALSKESMPRPGTPLSVGQNVLLRYKVSHTLNNGDNAQQSDMAVFVNIFGRDPAGNVVSIGGAPDRTISPLAVSNVLQDSIPFIVPAGLAGVFVEAFLDTLPFANPVVALDSQSWPVR